jgi:Predicted dehydrogenases and related proteins
MDNGCHAIDIAAFLFDPVSAIRTTVLKRLQEIDVEDSATIEIRTRSGIVGRADVSWSVNTGRDSYVTVYGADGAIEIGWRSCRMRRGDHGWQEIGGGYDKIDCHRRMFASFVQMLRSNGIGCAPWIDSKDAVACVAAVEAAYRSIDSGTWEWVTAEQPEMEELDAEVGA